MVTSLLKTKLCVPPLRLDPATGLETRRVQRTRLIARLNEGSYRNVTLISAPAGFGKSTLLSEWIHSIVESEEYRVRKRGSGHKAPSASPLLPTSFSVLPTSNFAWVSLDEGDNDPARFLAYVIAALQGTGVEQDTGSQVGKGLSDLLQSPQRLPVEELLTALINQISTISGRLVLILDDYHAIHAQPVHDALAFLLEHIPPQMHVVISTREDPPLPLARLRGRGQLTELRQADLRFTADETAEFLNQVMGLGLSVEDIAVLAARTEGWIAALHLAALQVATVSSRDSAGAEPQPHGEPCPHGAVGAFIRAFAGSDRFILDYLMEEVFSRQPKHIQAFLLHTAVLDRLSAPVCDAVLEWDTGPGAAALPASVAAGSAASSQAILESLDRANLFIVPLDNERRWYRYHHLFADLLRLRLQQTQPEMAPILHGRAGAWYEQNRFVEAAIDHALAAGDMDWATALVEGEAQATVMRSELATLRRWVQALPEDIVRTRPLLCVFDTWALLVGGAPLDVAEARLQDAVDADLCGAFAGEVLAVRALIAAYQCRTRESVELSQRALDRLPEDRTFFRSFVAGYLGLNHMYSGDLASARRAFEEAACLAQKIGNVMNAAMAIIHLAELSAIQGQIHRAQETYEQALALAVNGDGRRLPVAGVALIGLGRLLQLSNQLEQAQNYLDEGIELVKRWAEAGAIGGYIGQAFVQQARGNEAVARAEIQAAEDLALGFDAMRADDDYVAANKANLCVLQGDLDQAARWAAGCDLEGAFRLSIPDQGGSDSTVPLNLTYEYLTLARLRVAQGRYDEALVILRSLRRETEAAGWMIFSIRALVLEAMVLHAQSQPARALAALGRALTLAEPEGYVRAFLDEGPAMAEMLYQAAAQGLSPEFSGKLLVEFGEAGSRAAAADLPSESSKPERLIEPLSERELEVLDLIAEGLTNREIAQKLYLSLSTVKAHTYNMYGKLDVHSRTQAVARARMLGLLPLT